MCKTTDPWGKWGEPAFVKKAAGWIDPCPFWDEDGKAYMVNAFARSRIGFKSFLYMTPIEPDCSDILDDGQFVYDGPSQLSKAPSFTREMDIITYSHPQEG